ncbi:hypothetical protein B0H10DRAFT_2210301 [Mycena sp. CBHHK59/15]|nr:hypothetical protein B0H10DRAFT_2210301 [Mycena sp. CBHHK59/15]
MNDDVDNANGSHRDCPDATYGTRPASNTIFAQLRSFSLSANSLGSLFTSGSANSNSSSSSLAPRNAHLNACAQNALPSINACDSYAWRVTHDSVHVPDTVATPTPTRPPSPQRRFPDVKRIFTSLAATRKPPPPPSPKPHLPALALDDRTPQPRRESSASAYFDVDAPDEALPSYGSSVFDDTPPLTPDSLVLLSPADGYAYDYPRTEQDDDYMLVDGPDPGAYARPHSLEIKEGKKPARPICYNALLEDLAGPADAPLGDAGLDVAAGDDGDEWYGLEYMLELSTRERRASDPHSFSAGEHSKSRESWAAIHQGTVHPIFEDEEYYQWKSWHRYLDREDERRRHRRGRAFKARAKERAWAYADEMRTRDLAVWQMEVYGEVGRDVQEHLRALEQHRPVGGRARAPSSSRRRLTGDVVLQDPYHPPVKHGLGWHLKRSRSVASVRELCPLPDVAGDPASTLAEQGVLPNLPQSRTFVSLLATAYTLSQPILETFAHLRSLSSSLSVHFCIELGIPGM